MQLKLSVDMDIAAFADEGDGEIGDILRRVALLIEREGHGAGYKTQSILDVNGNRVGSWKVA